MVSDRPRNPVGGPDDVGVRAPRPVYAVPSHADRENESERERESEGQERCRDRETNWGEKEGKWTKKRDNEE